MQSKRSKHTQKRKQRKTHNKQSIRNPQRPPAGKGIGLDWQEFSALSEVSFAVTAGVLSAKKDGKK